MGNTPGRRSPPPRSGHGGYLPAAPTAHAQPTLVLQPESDGNPAITLTAYKHEQSASHKPQPLVRIFEPTAHGTCSAATAAEFVHGDDDDDDGDDDAFALPVPLYTNLARMKVTMGENAHIRKLRLELEEPFQELKDAFEDSTGRDWNPLTCWESEEWEWDDGGNEAQEELGIFEWIGVSTLQLAVENAWCGRPSLTLFLRTGSD